VVSRMVYTCTLTLLCAELTMVPTVAQKVASGVKTGAFHLFFSISHANNCISAVNFVKKNGAKIAKFGLEVVSTASSVASKFAKFIPVVGSAVSTALNVESKVTGIASNAIHADLGSQLDKGMQIMDKIQHPVSECHHFFLSEHFGQNILTSFVVQVECWVR
jgi:TctA family transporter